MDIKPSAKERITAEIGGSIVDGIPGGLLNACHAVFDTGIVYIQSSWFIIARHGIYLDLIRSIVIENGIGDIHIAIYQQGIGIPLVTGKSAIRKTQIRLVLGTYIDHFTMRVDVAEQAIVEAEVVALLRKLDSSDCYR